MIFLPTFIYVIHKIHINLKMQQNATEKLAAILSGGKPVAKNKNSH